MVFYIEGIMKKRSLICLSLFLLLSVSTCLNPRWSYAAPAMCTITGTVNNPDGTALQNTVIIFNTPQQIIAGELIQAGINSTITDTAGAITAIALPQGAITQIRVGSSVPTTGIIPASATADFTTVVSGIMALLPGVVQTTRTISTTSPLTGGGDLSANRTFACATCGVTGSPLSQFAATTSAQLLGVISDE